MTSYRVFITPRALKEAKELPGHMRQRVRRAIQAFFGGRPRVRRYKALVALAYLPRAVAAGVASLARPAWPPSRQARLFHRLLAELPGM